MSLGTCCTPGRLALLATLLLGFGSGSWGAEPRCTEADHAAAADLLQAKVRSPKLYAWTKPECLRFQVEQCDAQQVDIAVRELHNESCGGDPATAPVVDRFRVQRLTQTIEWYHAAKGEYRPFNQMPELRKPRTAGQAFLRAD